jgi:hypothetical protein
MLHYTRGRILEWHIRNDFKILEVIKMKVKELMQILEKLDQDQVIRVVLPIEGRKHGGGFLKEVSEVS